MTGPTDNPCGSADLKMRHHIWSFVSWSIRATSQSIGSACACKSNSSWPKMQIDQFIQSQSVNRHTLACKQADKWCAGNIASRAKIIPNPLRRRRHRLRPSAQHKILINPWLQASVRTQEASRTKCPWDDFHRHQRSSPDVAKTTDFREILISAICALAEPDN